MTLELLVLALPMIGMTISRMLMGFIDFWWVSQLGSDAQAAIYPSTLLLFTIACVGMGLSQGVQTFVSQADGRGEPWRAGVYLWQTLYVAIAAALLSAPLVIGVGGWFPLLSGLGRHPPSVAAMEIEFLGWALWSIGPMTACAGLESFYNGIRRPIIGLYAMLASLVVIIVGNYALIFGHLGFAPMGIAGSGLATVAAWMTRLAVLAVPLTWPALAERYGLRLSLRPQFDKLAEIVRVGGPISFQWLVDIGAWLVFTQAMIPPFGTVAMAAAGLTIQYMHLSFMPALGIGMALTTQVGNAIGAARPDEAVQRVRVGRRLIVLYMGVMSLLFIVSGRGLAGWLCYESDPATHAAVVAAAAAMLVWVGLFQVPDALCIVYSFASRGAGDTRVPALLFAVCCWVIFVGGGYALIVLTPGLGFHGPWMMCAAYIAVLGVLLWRRFHSGAWRRITLFGDSAARGFPVQNVEHATAEPVEAREV